MSEQYGCPECGLIEYVDKLVIRCPTCETLMEHLRWTKGGNGSHWDGCEEVHWDCKIAKLEAEKESQVHLLEEVWAKTESYRVRMDYHMMLRGESKKAYEELHARVEKALGKSGRMPYALTEEREKG